LTILRHFVNELAAIDELNVINVVVDKRAKPVDYDAFAMAWKTLVQRFENTITHRRFVGPANADDKGVIITDNTDNQRLDRLLRKMRRYNPVPNQRQLGSGMRDLPLVQIIEDPNYRDSIHSFFIQAADVIAFWLKQKKQPNSYVLKKGTKNYFDRLDPILRKECCPSDPQGIVCL